MKICFMGTSEFSLASLKKLLEHNYKVDAIYTKMPKPQGRGNKLTKSLVHIFAESRGINVLTPKSLRNKELQQEFKAKNFDLCIVVSYGLMLPLEILQAPKYGCINVHGSLLPKLRGASPIQMAIIEEEKTGITIMQMDEGMDSGDILLQEEMPITNNTTFLSLYNDLSIMGANLLIKTIEMLEKGTLKPKKQDLNLVTYAKILNKEDGKISFAEKASIINKKVRAFNPYPSTYFYYHGEMIKILETQVIKTAHQYTAGEIISIFPLRIACLEDVIEIKTLQRMGKKPLKADDFLRGFSMQVGDIILNSQ